ncbi:hypothetical protein [Streptomyces sp. NPDC001678]|uniref:hypothetical protein n=1 Tax=Streptomyces sp. NPDC001678 TaxID=3364599 RepID=UPI0036AF60D4
MDTLHLVLNAVTVIFIAATMFAAGLRATVPALRGVFADVPLLSLARRCRYCSPPSAASPSPTSPLFWAHLPRSS